MQMDILFQGFPGRSSRGFLGWSSCVLLRFPDRGPVLYDTAGFNERYQLLEMLQAIGVRPEEIETVFLSHFHFDHAVNFQMFPNARYYLHEQEVEHVLHNGRNDLAVPFEMFPALQNSGRLEILRGSSGTVNGLRWLHTPGHTPGLYSLLLDWQEQRWALVSDTAKTMNELITGEVQMAWDKQQAEDSIEKIRSWADVVVPGHDRVLKIVRNGSEVQVVPADKTTVGITVFRREGDENVILSV